MNNEVNEYIEKQKSPQKEICKKLQAIILRTFPGINERMKYGVPWYQDKYYMVALRDYVNLGVSVKGLSQDELALFEGKGKMMRHIKIRTLDEMDEDKIIELLKVIKDGC
ncbi:DUF1801 domain-containing protein [Chloroflexota bacterium]